MRQRPRGSGRETRALFFAAVALTTCVSAWAEDPKATVAPTVASTVAPPVAPTVSPTVSPTVVPTVVPAVAPAATPAVAPAQTVKVRVRVKGKGNVVRRAEVRVGGNRYFCDRNGIAELPASSAGATVVISKSGFDTQEFTLSESLSPKETVDIFLVTAADAPIDTIIVTGEREPAISRKQMSQGELNRLSPSDPTRAVRLLPGVQTTTHRGDGGGRGGRGDGGGEGRGGGPGGSNGKGVSAASLAGRGGGGSSGIVIRGSAASESRYFVDDIEVPYVFHSISELSILPGAMVSGLQFDSGGFSTHYGDAMGGIIVINTPSTLPQENSGEVTVNVPWYSGIYWRGALDSDSAMSASYRRSYIDFFLKLYLDNSKLGTSIGTLAPVFSDAHLQYIKKTPDGTMRKFTLLGAQDGLKVVFGEDLVRALDISQIEFSTSALTAAYEQTGMFDGSTRYRLTPQVSYVLTTLEFGKSNSRADFWSARLPIEATRELSDSTSLTLGADPNYKWQADRSTFVTKSMATGLYETDRESHSYEVGNPAAWVMLGQQIGGLRLMPQARVAYNTQIKHYAFDPRMIATQKLSESNTLKASAGRYSMSPSASEASPSSGNPNLTYQRMYQYVLGLETQWNFEYTSEVQLFLKEGYGMITSNRTSVYDNEGRAEIWGVELMGRRAFTDRWFGFFSYTYSKAITRESVHEPFERSNNDQRHVGSVAGSYRLSTTWELAGNYRYSSGGTYVPAKGGFYNTAIDRYVPNDSSGEKDMPPSQSLTSYFLKEFLHDTWKIDLKFGMESWWYTQQVSSMQKTYDYSREVAVSSLYAIPFLEVKGVF